MDPSPETETPPAPAGELAIRIERDGELVVTYDGEPVPVSSIEIDPISLRRLEGRRKRLLR